LRSLAVNADDFGFTSDVNEGIVEAHVKGILTSTTLMATGAAFDGAVRLAKQHPSLDIGCHLVLVGEPGFPPTIPKFLEAVARKRLHVYDELAAQVRRIVDAGLHPTHLDTHKHTHLLPAVLRAVIRVSEEFRIPWIRRPFDFPLQPGGIPWKRRMVNRAISAVRGRSERLLQKHGCRFTDHFAGFQLTGYYDGAMLVTLIRSLPEGSTEFMCHPGHCGAELRGARTRLKESREQELLALTAPEVRAAIAEANVRLAPFSQL